MVKEKETRESLVGGIETEATGCSLSLIRAVSVSAGYAKAATRE